ncbi:MAG: patatin-like phospholipase family protein [Gemmatimonadales bacterium]
MNVVLVFGGGGAKSLACAGAWRAMVEAGLTPGHLVGTSMGAVVAAAFASGATYDEVVIAGRALSRREVAPIDPLAFVKGVFATHVLKPDGPRRVIERLVPATRFAELRIPLTITSTDLDSGEVVLFGAGGRSDVPLRDALYASCALPLYFPPGVIDGRRLGDGGLRAVLGLEAAARIPADLVVAIHVGPGFDEPPVPPPTASYRLLPPLLPPPLIRAHGAAIRVMMAAQVERLIADWPKDAARLVVVRPVAEREATFAVGAGERYVRAGYEATKRALADTLRAC